MSITFPLMGLPVRITGSALFVLAFLVLQGGAADMGSSLLWGLVIFGSILVHEMGHALAGRALGVEPKGIVLHGFGGLCMYDRPMSAGKGLLVTLAGPGAGLLLGGLAFVIGRVVSIPGPLLGWLVLTNVFWSLFNLLPMLPLDGGMAVRHGLELVTTRGKAARVARALTVPTAVGVIAWGIWSGFWFVSLVGGLSLVQVFLRRG